jgi:hypothetical protein
MCTEWNSTWIPTCLWGSCIPPINSTTHNNNNTTPLTCSCHPNIRHDRLHAHFNNCGMPELAIDILCSLSFIVSFLACLCNIYVARQTKPKTPLRSTTLSAVSVNIFAMLVVIDIMVSRMFTPWQFIFYLGVVYSTCYMAAYLILSVLQPVSRISAGIEFRYRPWRNFFLKIQAPIFMVALLILYGIAFGIDSTSPNDKTYNDFVISQVVVYDAIVIVFTPSFMSFTFQLESGLSLAQRVGREQEAHRRTSHMSGNHHVSEPYTSTPQTTRPSPPSTPPGGGGGVPNRNSKTSIATTTITNNNNNSPNSSPRLSPGMGSPERRAVVNDLLERVKFIRKASTFAGFTMLFVGTFVLVLQYVFATVPLYGFIYILAMLSVSLWSIFIAWYAQKRRVEERRLSRLLPLIADRVSILTKQLSTGLLHLLPRLSTSTDDLMNQQQLDINTQLNSISLQQQSSLQQQNPNNNVLLPAIPSTIKEDETKSM